MREREASDRVAPPGVVEEVGDHDDLTPPRTSPLERTQRSREVGVAAWLLRSSGDVVQLRQRGEQLGPRRGRSEPDDVVAPRDEQAEPVSVTRGEEPERGCRRERHVGFLPLRRPEAHARRAIDHGPRLQLAVGFGRADLRRDRTGGEVPVDPARVVAGLVRTRAGDLGTGTALAPEELAPRNKPSSRRVTSSSRRRSSAALRATGATPSAPRSVPSFMRCPASRSPASASPAAPASSPARGR